MRPKAYTKPQDKVQVKKEIENHAKLTHPNILRLFDHSYNGVMYVKGLPDGENSYVYLVTEYLGRNYINMFDLIEFSGGNGFGEDAGRLFLTQMLDGLDYMHREVAVVHRDLKLENILIDGNLTFKIIDLGLSDSGNVHKVQGAVGSPSYVAPEVLTDSIYDGTKVDLFSLGVLLFVIVQGKFPHGAKILRDKYYDMIRRKQFDAYFRAVDSTGASDGFKNLITSLLAYDVSERPTIAQIRASPYLKEKSYCPTQTRTFLMTKI